MYSLENKEVFNVGESKKLIVLTYHVQDGAGYTVQKHYLLANVPVAPPYREIDKDRSSDDTG